MLGLTRHQKIAESSQFITQGETYDILSRVFNLLVATDRLHTGASIPYELFFLNDSEVNAFSIGGGRVYVTNGLVQAIKGSEGMLAFVLGHEMAHVLRQHALKSYLRTVQREQMTRFYTDRCRAGDKVSCWANIAYQVAARIAENKIDRDQENEADSIGIMASAEAGYHPDYSILAARLLRSATGEQSKFAAFFSDHPRWATREERAELNYDAAVAAFERRWTSLDDSPGGVPPAIASLTDMKIVKRGKAEVLQTSLRLRNLRTPATLRAILTDQNNGHPIELFSRQYSTDVPQPIEITVEVPQETFKGRKGKQFAKFDISAGSEILGQSKQLKAK